MCCCDCLVFVYGLLQNLFVAHVCFGCCPNLIKIHEPIHLDHVFFLPTLSEPYHTGDETREGRRTAAATMSTPGSPFEEVIHSLAGLHHFCLISRVGIPKEILTDQGMAFM